MDRQNGGAAGSIGTLESGQRVDRIPIKLGDRVKCTLSGFEGTDVARTEHLHASTTVLVVPPGLVGGMPPGGLWMEEKRLEVIPEGEVPTEAGPRLAA